MERPNRNFLLSSFLLIPSPPHVFSLYCLILLTSQFYHLPFWICTELWWILTYSFGVLVALRASLSLKRQAKLDLKSASCSGDLSDPSVWLPRLLVLPDFLLESIWPCKLHFTSFLAQGSASFPLSTEWWITLGVLLASSPYWLRGSWDSDLLTDPLLHALSHLKGHRYPTPR